MGDMIITIKTYYFISDHTMNTPCTTMKGHAMTCPHNQVLSKLQTEIIWWVGWLHMICDRMCEATQNPKVCTHMRAHIP